MARVRQVQSSVGLPVPLGLMRAGSEGVLVELGLGEEADLVSCRVRVRVRVTVTVTVRVRARVRVRFRVRVRVRVSVSVRVRVRVRGRVKFRVRVSTPRRAGRRRSDRRGQCTPGLGLGLG